ncbi:MAG TPA: hypothetical protein VIQ27_05965 [Gemmatimonadales bacterium]|jgi:hypothetical protein
MSEFAWSKQVESLSTMLNTLEGDVAAGGALSTPGVAEFKSALDDLRLRTWSLLAAANADDPHAFQEQFRTHRGTEMCRALSTDLRTGKLSGHQPALPALGTAARDLSAAVKEATRKPPKRRGKGAV